MHPSAPAPGATSAPTDSMQSLVAHLDDVMAQAEIAANAERDLDAENPTASTVRQETAPDDQDADEEDVSDEPGPDDESQEGEDEDESDQSADEDEAAEKPTAPPATSDQPKYSRRDAARFATELQSTKTALDQAKAQLQQHQGELAYIKSSDQTIRQHLQEQSGYVQEQNGRFRYENLKDRVLKGSATPEEQEEVARMTTWHEFAAPIFRAAEEMVLRSFAVNWNSLKDLDGVGDEGLKKLGAAGNSTVDGVKALHAMAYAAGESKAKAEAQQTIATLKAQVKSLKNGKVSSAPQPASANGAGVPSKGGVLSRAIGPDGLSNPDFDREVAQGKWLGADLSQS